MKITDLELEQYGIYRAESFKPAQDRLVVVMGENESGKTTLLNFIRDMLFGYRRGLWQDRMGNMGFLRENGDSFRVYRHQKDSWFEDAKGETYEEELPALWWHGLSRGMYEKIFAVGLEDLQGAGFLSQNDVKSRFFFLSGGDRLAGAEKALQEEMETLLLPSAQGKRKINRLLEKLKAVNEEMETLSAQEEDFAKLRKRQEEIRAHIGALEKSLAERKEEDKRLEKKLGAWQYYVRAREIKRQLALSEQVKLFPKNGKEQWNQLMNRMETIHGQREALAEKLAGYTPRKKEEIIPWTAAADELESLYTDLGQWNTTIEELDELQKEKQRWKVEFCHMGYALPLWDRMLSADEEVPPVDWDEGRKLAQSLNIRNNELHFWEKREPVVEEPELSEEDRPRQTEEEWHAFEEKADEIETLVHEEADLKEKWDSLSRVEDRRFTMWFWCGLASALAAAGGVGAFLAAAAGFAALYAAGGFAAAAAFLFFVNSRLASKKGKDTEKLRKALEEVKSRREGLGRDFPLPLPENEEGLPVFRNALQQKRAEFYQAQAKAQAFSWKLESVERQKNEHKKWEEEGVGLSKEKARVEEAWKSWLTRHRLPDAACEQLAQLQGEWQQIYASLGAGKILDVRIEKTQERLDGFVRRALSIIRQTGMKLEASPETVAEIYEENRKRLLEWQAVAEKNRQHETYEKEMEALDSQWESCRKNVSALLDLVNAKNAEEFAERVTAHEQHDQLQKEWEAVRRDIRLYAGSDENFALLWNSLENGEYDEWMESHKTLGDEIAAEEAELGEARKQQGAVENEIYRLANDETVTAVLQERDAVKSELSRAAEEWLTCFYASHFLQKAQRRYESGKRPKILERANDFLSKMTDGRYSLEVSADGREVSTVDAVHNKKDANIWSSGTGDQVYLALRLAMALAFGRQLEPLPIVLDDIFVRFDEKRQRETLRFLLELGKEQQIFLFTCHAQTMRIAREEGEKAGTGEFIRLKNGRILSAENA